MRIIKKTTTIVFTLIILAAAVALTPDAYAKTYKNGIYKVTVELSASGMNHNKLVSPATLTVKDGNYYIDLVFKRVKGDGAPQYTSMTTACGTFTERSLDEGAQTCTFKGVQIPDAGDFDVTTVTEAMSQPYEVDYTISVDASGIPEADEVTTTTAVSSGNSGESEEDNAGSATAVASSDGVTLPEKPTAPLTPEESSLAEEKEEEENIDIADTLEEVLTIGALEEEDSGLGTGAIIAIVAGAAVLIAAAVVIVIKIKKK